MLCGAVLPRRPRERHAPGHHLVRLEAQVLREQPDQAPRHERRAREQRKRERELSGDEAVAKTAAPPARGGPTAAGHTVRSNRIGRRRWPVPARRPRPRAPRAARGRPASARRERGRGGRAGDRVCPHSSPPTSQATPSRATITPMTAPPTAARTLSVTSCRTIRPRVAPIAIRTASSRARPRVRLRSNPAALAHAMTSTSHDREGEDDERRPDLPDDTRSRSGRTKAPRPRLVSGYADSSRCMTRSRPSRASSMLLPAASRPTT